MKILGIAGWSGSGKTTLIERLLPLLRARGLAVSVVKHTHHDFDLDRPGKDSWRHREAGAREVMLVGPTAWALMREHRDAPEAELDALLARLSPCDLVLVEGFKRVPMPRLEVWRAANGKPPLWPDDPDVIAVAGDAAPGLALPHFALDDVEAIAAFVVGRCGFRPVDEASMIPRT